MRKYIAMELMASHEKI